MNTLRGPLLLALIVLTGCGRSEPGASGAREVGAALPVETREGDAPGFVRPLGDLDSLTARAASLTLVRVAPQRASVQPALPDAELAPVPPGGEAPREALAIDDELRPPIARTSAQLDLSRVHRGWVELDVRVDEQGEVSDALFAEGDADSVTVAAAIEAALAMRFHPAVQSGRPVAVWCRQRFDLRK